MQTVAQKSATRSVAARPSARSARSVVVHASADSRRSVLTGFLAGAAALATVAPAFALTPVDLIDDRKVKSTGYDIIYEARDVDLPQAQRDGLSQPRAALDECKARVRLSELRIDTELEPVISKSYWTEAREQLRRQVGTLRFDLNVLAEARPKAEKKAALELKKDFLKEVEALDFAIRSKNRTEALTKLETAKQGLDAVLASVM